MSRGVKSFNFGLFSDTVPHSGQMERCKDVKVTACEMALMGHFMLLSDSVENLCSCLVFTLHVFKGDNWSVSCFNENLSTGFFSDNA